MNREKELEQALKQFVNKTEEAIDGGWANTREFKEVIKKVRQNVLNEEMKTGKDIPYPKSADFNVLMQ